MKPDIIHIAALEAKDARIKELEESRENLRRELSHLVFLMEPLEQSGELNIPGLATLNGARKALGIEAEYDPTPPQICSWELFDDEWKLMVAGRGHAASVWLNGTWHTWNPHGVGGENSSEETVAKAKIEAAASAIAQGFI